MKLIIAGATGFVATEVIRQSLQLTQFDEVVALARQPVSVPTGLGPGANTSKLRSVVISDYGEYADEVKEQIANADACIWTVAVTPTKSKSYSYEELRKICHDNTLVGLKAIFEARGSKPSVTPFRFVYMSGIAAERDQTKTPDFMPPYSLLRGETESAVLKFADEHPGQIEACVAKPGLIARPGDYLKAALGFVLKWVKGVPNILVTEISAAMLNQVINGFEKEPLLNDDLVKIGRKALQAQETATE